jgi:hypothetical protein
MNPIYLIFTALMAYFAFNMSSKKPPRAKENTEQTTTMPPIPKESPYDIKNWGGWIRRESRRNNPGNIRPSNSKWQGQSGTSNNFVIFENEMYGMRAMCKLLRNYIRDKKLVTVKAIINTYCPVKQGENTPLQVTNYIKHVENQTGAHGAFVYNAKDLKAIARLAWSMAQFEQGYETAALEAFEYAAKLIDK